MLTLSVLNHLLLEFEGFRVRRDRERERDAVRSQPLCYPSEHCLLDYWQPQSVPVSGGGRTLEASLVASSATNIFTFSALHY